MDTFSIGQAARHVGISTRAIRLWEARGLIPPAPRTSARYRTFSEADLSSMRFIRKAQRLGLTLDQIQRVVEASQAGNRPCGEVRRLIDHRIRDIDGAISELMRLRASLEAARHDDGSQDIAASDPCVCHIIENTVDSTQGVDDGE